MATAGEKLTTNLMKNLNRALRTGAKNDSAKASINSKAIFSTISDIKVYIIQKNDYSGKIV